MPYELIFKYEDGRIASIKPIACDNPKSEYGLEDRRIQKKLTKLAKALSKKNSDLECSVGHYDE